MTDIVERLRTLHREITECDGGECEMMVTVRHAADEIERLRAAVKFCSHCGCDPDLHDGATRRIGELEKEVERLRDLTQVLLDNDPNDIVADGGVTVLDAWRKDAYALLRKRDA